MSVCLGEINELSLPSIPFVLMAAVAAESGSCCLERESEAAGTLIHALNSFHTILTQRRLPLLFKVRKFEDPAYAVANSVAINGNNKIPKTLTSIDPYKKACWPEISPHQLPTTRSGKIAP